MLKRDSRRRAKQTHPSRSVDVFPLAQ